MNDGEGYVVQVSDGDTINVNADETKLKVRLDIMDIDKYRRMIAIVWIGSRNINREMVAEGWAWAYREYLKGPYASEFIHDEE